MRKLITVLAVAALVAPALAAPLDRADVDPAAKWVVHIDAERFVDSGLGEAVLDSGEKHNLDAKINVFTRIFGFDPTEDLASITVYGFGLQPDRGVAIFRGELDIEHLKDLTRANSAYDRHEADGLVLHRWRKGDDGGDDSGTRFTVFHDDSTVLVGRRMDVLVRAVEALEDDAAAERIPSTRDGAFLVAGLDGLPSADPAKRDPKARILRRLTGGFVQIGEADDQTFINARLAADSSADARRFLRIGQGVLAFAEMLAEETGENGRPIGALAPVIAAAEVSRDGAKVEFDLSMDTDALVEALKEAHERRLAEKAKGSSD